MHFAAKRQIGPGNADSHLEIFSVDRQFHRKGRKPNITNPGQLCQMIASEGSMPGARLMGSVQYVGVHLIKLAIEKYHFIALAYSNFFHFPLTSQLGSRLATPKELTPLQKWENTVQTRLPNCWMIFDAGDQDTMCKRGGVG